MVHVLSSSQSILNQFIAEIRDIEIQRDNMRFRKNLERLGAIFAYAISNQLTYDLKEVVTPLGIANVPMLKEYPVLATILRAGLPFHQGLLSFFDKSENAFISAFRQHQKDGTFSINIEYASMTDIENKVVILSDTMLASGSSMVLAYRELITHGKPKHTHIATILASTEGLEYVKKHLTRQDVTIWVGVIDEELTAQSYIVPGLGDAGDLAYGIKH
ncbi:MAG: uracil phosphoribosyltransferase [Bacteroidales bacterium]|jgi:uracil phosphoribosyltransferase|nr:uracil phosphoribosyltransferase [Bacteroidales bacterium]